MLAGTVAPAAADTVTEWNDILLQMISSTGMPPPRASRAMAMVQTAVYDAVNSVDQTHEPYLGFISTGPVVSKEAAAACAAHRVLKTLFTGAPQQTALDTALADTLADIAPGAARDAGVALGEAAGDATIASRMSDNAGLMPPPFMGGSAPGQWRPTTPGTSGLLPHWGTVTPFGIPDVVALRPPAPPALGTPEYRADYEEVKLWGRATGSPRTPDQDDIARMWAAGAGTVTPPGLWNQVASQVSASQGLTIDENARLFALLGMAVADSGIQCWDTKYEYVLWRPVTAIREDDGDPLTDPDPAWTSFIATPPFPAYTSGHSTFSSSAAAILAAFFGTDDMIFSVTSAGITRNFSSFALAAAEAGQSRIFGGIHFQFDNYWGLLSGETIGDYIAANYLQRIPAPGTLGVLALGGLLAARRRR
jgi:hypothetical protein